MAHVEGLVDATLLVLAEAAELRPDCRCRATEARHATQHAAGEAHGRIGGAAAPCDDRRPPHEGHPGAIEDQQRAHADLERARRAHVPAASCRSARQRGRPRNRPQTRPANAFPDGRQGLHVAGDAAERGERGGGERRHGLKPEAQRHQRITRAAHPVDESRHECPGDDDRDVAGGRQVHAGYAPDENAWMPVMARPRISAWTSCVPS